jgi:hypothetical protein
LFLTALAKKDTECWGARGQPSLPSLLEAKYYTLKTASLQSHYTDTVVIDVPVEKNYEKSTQRQLGICSMKNLQVKEKEVVQPPTEISHVADRKKRILLLCHGMRFKIFPLTITWDSAELRSSRPHLVL